MTPSSPNTAARQLSSLVRLHDVGTACVQDGDLAGLLDTLLEEVIHITHADFGGIQLRDPGTGRLRLAAQHGYPADFATFIDGQREDARPCGAASAGGPPLIVEDVRTAAGVSDGDRTALLAADAPAFQTTPLCSKGGHSLGVVTTFFHGSHVPTDEQLQLAGVFAGQAADFMMSSRLRTDMQAECARERTARVDANAANRSTSEFLATLAHELRQPLAAAFAAIEVQRRSLSAERREHAGDIIQQQLGHLARLVDDLSDASRISLGTIVLHRVTLDLRVVLQQALDMAAPAFYRGEHTVAVTLSPDPVYVSADATRMKQVFSNLLQNAAAYTPPGGLVSVSLDCEDGRAVFRIRDNGVGIPAELMRRIFELFERGSAHSDTPSSGIGLAVVRRLVELHGGTVSATSDGAGEGSEFVVALQCVPGPGA